MKEAPVALETPFRYQAQLTFPVSGGTAVLTVICAPLASDACCPLKVTVMGSASAGVMFTVMLPVATLIWVKSNVPEVVWSFTMRATSIAPITRMPLSRSSTVRV